MANHHGYNTPMGNDMSNLKFIEMGSYTAPEIVEKKNKDWVEYGADNNYYQYLIDLYYGSPTNNAAIKGIADLIFGQGLEVVRGDRHLQGYIEFKTLFDDECLRNAAMDLKMLGQCAIHLVKSKDRKKYVRAYHWPIQTLRPEKCNEDGDITGYYYCADWANLKRGQVPKRFDAFGFDKNANEAMLVIKPYSTGNFYFAPVDYQGGTQYCELETEIANYHINNIKNGLAPSMLINFNNGQPPAEVKDMVEAQIAAKFQGSSNAGKWIISWNDGKDSSADITPVQLSDAHNQYQFLSSECIQKILIAHRVTSPMLLGIKDSTGLGNNAEELKTASILFDNTVIRPFQRLLIGSVSKVLNANGVSLELYFKTLQPLEFTDLSGKPVDKATEEKEYGFSKVELVKPTAGETKDEFIARCIPVLKAEGKDDDQAAAICYSYFEGEKMEMEETYTDYPESASNNAKKALDWAEKNGWGDCGTQVGKIRANQLANGKPISRDTIARMAAFRRHQQHKDVPYSEGCGGLMWDAWGGDSGIRWAESKLKEIDAKMSEADEQAWLEYLSDKGQVVDEQLWDLIEETPVTDDGEYAFFKRFADPEQKSKDDKGVYLIRYRYAPMQLSGNSRVFCQNMVANAKSGVVYRREDIDEMGEQGINGQFAPKGKTTYSIWKYKGGVNCHHQWYRLTYKRKQIKGKFIPLTPEEKAENIRMIEETYKRVSSQSADGAGVPFSPPDWKTASTKTIDLPNQGRIKR